MKKIFVFILTLIAVQSAFSQQRSNKDNMTITIYELSFPPGKPFHIIVTRTDSAQLQKDVDRTTIRKAKSMDKLAVHEALLHSIIQPYIDQDWQLVTTSVEGSVTQGSDNYHIYRYYLSKQK